MRPLSRAWQDTRLQGVFKEGQEVQTDKLPVLYLQGPTLCTYLLSLLPYPQELQVQLIFMHTLHFIIIIHITMHLYDNYKLKPQNIQQVGLSTDQSMQHNTKGISSREAARGHATPGQRYIYCYQNQRLYPPIVNVEKRPVANDKTTVLPMPKSFQHHVQFSQCLQILTQIQQSTAAVCFLPSASFGSRLLRQFLRLIADIQLDLSANVPLFVYLAISNHPALVNRS